MIGRGSIEFHLRLLVIDGWEEGVWLPLCANSKPSQLKIASYTRTAMKSTQV